RNVSRRAQGRARPGGAGGAHAGAPRRAPFSGRYGRALIGERQHQREGAALAHAAREPELAAEQPGELAADRQAEAGAAVLAAGRAVGLLEGLEDQLLLVRRNADA